MSLAEYIIICDGRIDVAISSNGFHRIRAASRTATELVKFYGDRITEADAQPLSTLQHEMMDLVEGKASKHAVSADEMVDQMFGLLEALEDKIKS